MPQIKHIYQIISRIKDIHNQQNTKKGTKAYNIEKIGEGNLQGSFSIRGVATSRGIHEMMRESAKRPQYAILAERRLILKTPQSDASHAQAAYITRCNARYCVHLILSFHNQTPTVAFIVDLVWLSR